MIKPVPYWLVQEYVMAREEAKLIAEGSIQFKSVVGEDHPSLQAQRLRERLRVEFKFDVDKFDKKLGS